MKINLEGANNVRNFVGIKNEFGNEILCKEYIRSNKLIDLTDDDVKILTNEYNLKTVIDLRTATERLDKPDRIIDGVLYDFYPVFSESAIGITHEKGTDMHAAGELEIPDMPKLYEKMADSDYSVSQLSKIMNTILDSENGVLWHCTEGKDRCGLVSALFLFMLDVSVEEVKKDYLMTNLVAEKRATGFYDKIVAATGDEEKALIVKKAFMANEDYLEGALNIILNKYKSKDEYIEKRLGIDMNKVEKLKRRCLG